MSERRWFIAVVVFLILAGALIFVALNYFLVPAMVAVNTATSEDGRWLGAVSLLVLCLLLLLVLMVLLLLFRPGRYFRAGGDHQRTTTPYIDAWAESAKRLPTPPAEDEAEEES